VYSRHGYAVIRAGAFLLVLIVALGDIVAHLIRVLFHERGSDSA